MISLAGLSRESGFKMIEHPPLSTDMTPVTTSFRFQSVWQLGITLTPEKLKMDRGRPLRTVPKNEFAKAFVRWQENFKQCFSSVAAM
jgi:hypothetical protein